MKWKFTRQILEMSKYAFIGVVLQALTCSMLLAEEAYSQKSIEEIYLAARYQNSNIEEVFRQIENSTGFKFAYKPEILEGKGELNLTFGRTSLANRQLSLSPHDGV